MDVLSQSRIREVLNPTGPAGGPTPYSVPVQSFSIEQIVHPHGLVVLVAESTASTDSIPVVSPIAM